MTKSIRARLTKPIVMVGLMGAGKTKIGGMLAQALELPFVDADVEIEAAAGRSVAEIFEEYGEAEFRDLERKVVARLLSDDLKVIATGGGAIMNEQTAALIHDKSVSVWLRADLDVLVQRTAGNAKRPLLKSGDPREILAALMEKRHDTYATATITVDTGLAEADETLGRVLNSLDAHLPAKDTHHHG